MIKKIQDHRNLLLLLLSVALFSFGQGVITTIVSLKVSDQNVGAITSVYYFGMLVGSLNSTFLVNKFGTIRTYAIFLCVACAASIALGFYTHMPVWYAARFSLGYSLALLYVVVEHSILTISNDNNRMKFLGLYGVSLYGTSALSQIYLRIFSLDSVLPFYIGAAVSLSAVLPVFMLGLKNTGADIEVKLSKLVKVYKIMPACIICTFLSGTMIASIYGLLPRHMEDIGLDVKHVSDLMACTLGGAVLLRYPVGRLSDFIGKGLALILSCAALLILCITWIVLAINSQNTTILMGSILFAFGGLIFTMYPICMAYLYENVHSDKYNADIPQGMLLSYSLGCICGPLFISCVVNLYKHGLFTSFAFVSICMLIILTRSDRQKYFKKEI